MDVSNIQSTGLQDAVQDYQAIYTNIQQMQNTLVTMNDDNASLSDRVKAYRSMMWYENHVVSENPSIQTKFFDYWQNKILPEVTEKALSLKLEVYMPETQFSVLASDGLDSLAKVGTQPNNVSCSVTVAVTDFKAIYDRLANISGIEVNKESASPFILHISGPIDALIQAGILVIG